MPVWTSVPVVDLERTIEIVRRVPDRYRRYTVSKARARAFFRIPPQALQDLLDLGLPHGADLDGPLFDEHDMRSIVLLLRLPSPQRTALTTMADALDAGAAGTRAHHTVNIQARCPGPHENSCEFNLVDPVRHSPDVVGIRVAGGHQFTVDLRLPTPPPTIFAFTPEQEQLVREVSAIEFFHVPFDLNSDLGFLAEARLADCRLATHFLQHRARELGIPVRQATGLFLSRPFANRHFWIEFQDQGRWLPADPFFLMVLHRWGVLDETRWPPNRSPLGAFWKLDIPLDDTLVTHRGGAAASFLAS